MSAAPVTRLDDMMAWFTADGAGLSEFCRCLGFWVLALGTLIRFKWTDTRSMADRQHYN